MKNFIASLAAALLLTLPGAASAGTVTVKGSDTMVILVQRWAGRALARASAWRPSSTRISPCPAAP
jgi:hypothetical protein